MREVEQSNRKARREERGCDFDDGLPTITAGETEDLIVAEHSDGLVQGASMTMSRELSLLKHRVAILKNALSKLAQE